MAYIVLAYLVMAYVVMANIVMAHTPKSKRGGLGRGESPLRATWLR